MGHNFKTVKDNSVFLVYVVDSKHMNIVRELQELKVSQIFTRAVNHQMKKM